MRFSKIYGSALAGAFFWASFLLALSGCTAAASSGAPEPGTPPTPTPTATAETASHESSNPDTVAWLTIPGTNIDGPVQQGPDNDYYLRRDSDGNEDYHGCYFADADAIVSLANLSRNVVIYGHTFTDGWEGGFEQLDKFLDADWAQDHTEIQLEIDGTTLTYEVCSVGICNVQETSLPIYCNLDDEVFAYLIEDANVRNQISGLKALSTTDQLLTLATCTENNNERLVIVAKQIYNNKKGTSEEETS